MAIAITTPKWPEKLLRIRLNSGRAIFSEIGLEKHCKRCNEYWPADSEFFYTAPSKKDGLNEWCKACYVENRKGISH